MIAAYEGERLESRLSGGQTLGVGGKKFAFLWLEFAGDVPTSLTNRIRFQSVVGGATAVQELVVPVSSETPVVLGPPLRGADW